MNVTTEKPNRITLANTAVDNFNSLLAKADGIEAVKLLNDGATLTIASDEQAELARQLGLDLKGILKKVEDALNPAIEEAFDHHKSLTTERGTYTDPINKVIKKLKLAVETYNLQKEKERKRLAEEKRKADEAEKARIEAENNKKAQEYGQQLADSAAKGEPPPPPPALFETPPAPIEEYTPPPSTTKGTTIKKEPQVVDLKRVPAYYPNLKLDVSMLKSMLSLVNATMRDEETMEKLCWLVNEFFTSTPEDAIEIRTIDMTKIKAIYKLNPDAKITGIEVQEVANTRW